MNTPTSADLLLALSVRDLAIRRRTTEINDVKDGDSAGRDFDTIAATWERTGNDYVREVTDELHRIWNTMDLHVKSKG